MADINFKAINQDLKWLGFEGTVSNKDDIFFLLKEIQKRYIDNEGNLDSCYAASFSDRVMHILNNVNVD